MPAGDSQRVWFPEVLGRLKREWGEAMPSAMLVQLRDSLGSMLHQTRFEQRISSPAFTCPKCGLRGRMAEPQVSVRAMILALGRFGITTSGKIRLSNESGPNTGTSTASISTARISSNPAMVQLVASRAHLRRIENGNAVSRNLNGEQI